MQKKIIAFIDNLLEKIPDEIQDLLQKIFLGMGIFGLFITIYFGFKVGSKSAQPKGVQMAKNTMDLFTEKIDKLNQKARNLGNVKNNAYDLGNIKITEENSKFKTFNTPVPGISEFQTNTATDSVQMDVFREMDRLGDEPIYNRIISKPFYNDSPVVKPKFNKQYSFNPL